MSAKVVLSRIADFPDEGDWFFLPGRSGGQVAHGGADAGDDLSLQSTSHATKGNILIGAASLYEDNGVGPRLGIGTLTPSEPIHAFWDIDGNVGLRMENPNAGPLAVARVIVDTDGGSGFLAAYGTGFAVVGGSRRANSASLISNNSLAAGLSLVARNAAAPIRFYAGGNTDTDEHLRLTPAGELILPQAADIILGGTAASADLNLRGTSAANLGTIHAQSPIIIDDAYPAYALSTYAVQYAPGTPGSPVQITGGFIGGGLNMSPIYEFYNGIHIAESFRGAPTIISRVAPALAAYTVMQSLPLLRGGSVANHNPLNALYLNAGGAIENNVAVSHTTTSVSAVNFAPTVRTTAAGAIMLITNYTGLTVAPKYSTVGGSSISFGTVRGVWCQNPALAFLGSGAGTEAMTAYIGLDVDTIGFGAGVTKVAVRSGLTPAANTYFLLNNGSAKSEFLLGDIHFNDTAGVVFGNQDDVRIEWSGARFRLDPAVGQLMDIGFGTNFVEMRSVLHAFDTVELYMGFHKFAFGQTGSAVGNHVGLFVAATRTTELAGEWSDFQLTQSGNLTVDHAMGPVVGWKISPPTVTLGTGSVSQSGVMSIEGNPNSGSQDRFGLRILSNPSGGSVINAALWVTAGLTRLDGLVEIANDLSFHGDGTGLPFGGMSNDSGTTVTITGANTWAEVTTGFVTGQVHNATFGGAHYLEVAKAGRYLVNLSITLESANNEVVGAAVAVNGVEQTAGHAHATIPGTNDNTSMSQTIILDLAANDQISVSVVNHGSATDLDVIHCSLTLAQIGGS